MVYTSVKRKLKEKPNYDTSLYRQVKTPTTPPPHRKVKTPTTSPRRKVKAPTTPPPRRKVKVPTTPTSAATGNNNNMFTSPDDGEKPTWSESQKAYASDYMARVLERYADNLGVYDRLVEVLRKYVERETEILVVWHHVCDLLSASPDLRDEFENFMWPHSRDWALEGGVFATRKY